MGKHDRHGDFTKNMRSYGDFVTYGYMAVCQNLVPLVNIKIAGKWMFIPLKMVLIGIDPYPYIYYIILVAISSPESRGWHPKNLRFWRALLHPYFATKIKDHGLASTQKQPIFDIFGLYLGRFLILQMGAPTVSRKCTKPYILVMELIL